MTRGFVDVEDDELDQPVVDENPVADVDVVGEPLVGDRNLVAAAPVASGTSTTSLPSASVRGAARSPMRMRGPCRSPRMATGRPISLATSRTSAMVAACCSCVPCEKLMRATLSPASTRPRNVVARRARGPQRADDLCSAVAQRSPVTRFVSSVVLSRLSTSSFPSAFVFFCRPASSVVERLLEARRCRRRAACR